MVSMAACEPLLTAFDQVRVGLALIDAGGLVARANPEMARIAGGPPIDWSSFPTALGLQTAGEGASHEAKVVATGIQTRWTVSAWSSTSTV
jgi:hypothetical protein